MVGKTPFRGMHAPIKCIAIVRCVAITATVCGGHTAHVYKHMLSMQQILATEPKTRRFPDCHKATAQPFEEKFSLSEPECSARIRVTLIKARWGNNPPSVALARACSCGPLYHSNSPWATINSCMPYEYSVFFFPWAETALCTKQLLSRLSTDQTSLLFMYTVISQFSQHFGLFCAT